MSPAVWPRAPSRTNLNHEPYDVAARHACMSKVVTCCHAQPCCWNPPSASLEGFDWVDRLNSIWSHAIAVHCTPRVVLQFAQSAASMAAFLTLPCLLQDCQAPCAWLISPGFDSVAQHAFVITICAFTTIQLIIVMFFSVTCFKKLNHPCGLHPCSTLVRCARTPHLPHLFIAVQHSLAAAALFSPSYFHADAGGLLYGCVHNPPLPLFSSSSARLPGVMYFHLQSSKLSFGCCHVGAVRKLLIVATCCCWHSGKA